MRFFQAFKNLKKFKINVLKNYGLTETSSLACCDKPNSKIRKHGASEYQ